MRGMSSTLNRWGAAMKKADFDAFASVLAGCLGMWNKVPSPDVSVMWFRALEGYELPILTAAFSAHIRDPENGKFEPKPAHIVAQIERTMKNDGRPGAEEAWATAFASQPEAETTVWTVETCRAWFDAARPLVMAGDKVGARMAFKEAYIRLVEEARAARVSVQWLVSEGFDHERKRVAIGRAVEAGLIHVDHLQRLALNNAPLLLGCDGIDPVSIPPAAREKLRELRERLSRPREPAPSPADLERQRLQALKREQRLKVDRYRSSAFTTSGEIDPSASPPSP